MRLLVYPDKPVCSGFLDPLLKKPGLGLVVDCICLDDSMKLGQRSVKSAHSREVARISTRR